MSPPRITCKKGHAMVEVDVQKLWTSEDTDECSWCGNQVDSHTFAFAVADAKKQGKSVANIAVFKCSPCDAVMCWKCAKLDFTPATGWVGDEGARPPSKKAASPAASDEDDMAAYFASKQQSGEAAEGKKGGGGCVIL
eukprot:gnl/TRDRNA2_/TRDRNA2_50724_c0_seq1.p1 gnl/TRDRNA2_/TRDRNA2_50724_c0~~gnl/TRDRNA2_/TRDRNA2_50724_c0_seq1.p1  ORF type:complete len:138 (-),score=29.69 gnl/TRDRNA2_/TRDRNA2_50724_c0_seq1:94-507(-)